jgi:hypothetical protein
MKSVGVTPITSTQGSIGLVRDPVLTSSPALLELSNEDFMDTPDLIRNWFARDNNYKFYILGVGRILMTKELTLSEISRNLKAQVRGVNDDYDAGISQVSQAITMDTLDPLSFEGAQKSSLKGSIGEDINKGYKTQYYELIQKSIRYDEAVSKLHGRRDYLVYHMNTDDIGYKHITDQIIKQAEVLFNQYKGVRYKFLRNLLFSMIRFISYSPEIVQKSFILNTSITGPAGSGKTTLARLLAKWYNVLGILTGDIYLDNEESAYREVGRPDLIGEYMGQTAPKTLGVLYSSLEKTLFIDEAYAVAGCAFKEDGSLVADSYGEEFISVLLPFIANHQGIGTVIVAGYNNFMEKCFFARNEGLPRRFPTRIDLPLYSTDELFSMFLGNVIGRKEKNIRDDDEGQRKKMQKSYRRGRQITYADIKVAFMMIHYDTSHHAIELLRKYLLLIEVRAAKHGGEKDTVKKSATITHHVLSCILSNQLRRNIIRWYFYKNVFDFNQSNLSFFPAQAGEMGLIADYVNKSIDLTISQLYMKKPDNVVKTTISYDEEVKLISNYYKEKPVSIELEYFKSGEDMSSELKMVGYSNKDFSDKICTILIDDVFKPEPPSGTRSAAAPQAGRPKIKMEGGSAISKKTRNITKKRRSSLKNKSMRVARGNSRPTGLLVGGATPVAAKSSGSDYLPTLKSLYEYLLDERISVEILMKVINLYIQIASVAIPEILKIPQDKFPVNMNIKEVMTENNIIKLYIKANKKSETSLFTSEIYGLYRHRSRSKDLQHPLFATNPGYAVWEDLGIDE